MEVKKNLLLQQILIEDALRGRTTARPPLELGHSFGRSPLCLATAGKHLWRILESCEDLVRIWWGLNSSECLKRLGNDLGGLESDLGHLGAFWRRLGPSPRRTWVSWRRLGRSWRRSRASWRRLGPSWRRLRGALSGLGGILETSWTVLEASWRLLKASL